ncbi:MAG: hypothetical protein Q9217_001878 [Psora testacea]
MSANARPTAKKGGGADTKYDMDNVLPVLLAVLGNPSINYSAMAAMDEAGRTEYAWQHRFRRWRSMASDIATAHPDVAAATAGKATPTKRAPAKKAVNGGKNKQMEQDKDDDDDEGGNEESKPKASKA